MTERILPGRAGNVSALRALGWCGISRIDAICGAIYRDADRFVGSDMAQRRSSPPQYGRVLETVLHSIAAHTGSPTQNATLLSSDSPAYRTTLPAVLDALAAWHISYTLPFRTAQITSKKGYSSKKYLFDTGLANYLLTRFLPVTFGRGSQTAAMLLENGVLQDIVSQTGSIKAITCYHSSNRVPTELDFVVRTGTAEVPVEVKSSDKVKLSALSQLFDFLARSGRASGYVVYTGKPDTLPREGKTIRLIPPYCVCCTTFE